MKPVELRNPAKPLMVLIGGSYVAFAPLAFLSGLQAGLHLMVGSALMLILGCGTIWLALQIFTPLFRGATIIWGLCLVAFFAFAGLSAYDPADIGGTVFFGLVLLIVIPIPILAFRQAPHLVVERAAGDTKFG